MKRTTISVPESLLARAKAVADRRGVSLGEVLRDALGDYLDGGRAWDPPRSLGVGDSRGAGRGRELCDLPEAAYGPAPQIVA